MDGKWSPQVKKVLEVSRKFTFYDAMPSPSLPVHVCTRAHTQILITKIRQKHVPIKQV